MPGETILPRLLVIVLLLSAIGFGRPAVAGESGPVCREPSVMDEMTREVRARNYYATVVPRLVTEQATADPRVVRCQVCVQSAPYTTTRLGERRIAQCVARVFEVQILTGGFVVGAMP